MSDPGLTAMEIKEIVMALLPDLLGKYKNQLGQEVPAILILDNSYTDPDAKWTTSGLECVITRVPMSSPVAVFGGAFMKERYKISLVYHGIKGLDLNYGSIVMKASHRIVARFRRAEIGNYQAPNDLQLEQIDLYIPHQRFAG